MVASFATQTLVQCVVLQGVGAQGGNLEAACEAAFDSRGLGIILPVSRGISTAEDPRRAAAEFRDRINAVRVSLYGPQPSGPFFVTCLPFSFGTDH